MNERSPADAERRQHNRQQAELFDRSVDFFVQPIPEDIAARTRRIVAAARLPDGARVLDVGTGVGVLVPHLLLAGASRIVACDLSERMLEQARLRYGDAVEFVCCDIIDLPDDRGPFDAIFFNAMFGNVYDPRATLRRARALLAPDRHVVISHPMGRAWHSRLRARQPEMVPRDLPDSRQLDPLLAAAALNLVEFVDEPDLYLLVAGAMATRKSAP
jgi:2-polyprenyl-3-methyl-5-hydroxy-6-metoxy-1,4-benzoquinol methylase